jgi:ribosomal protein S18 acetylase RimI-like enzyme
MPRPLTAADAAAVATLIRTVFADLPQQVDPPPSALHETADSIAAALAEGGGAGIEQHGTLVGCVLWREKPGGLYMGRLAVAAAARGQGLARHLVAAAEAEARQRGLKRLLLSTRLGMLANRRLFASCGFVETVQHAHPGYAVPTYVDMEKWLDKPA